MAKADDEEEEEDGEGRRFQQVRREWGKEIKGTLPGSLRNTSGSIYNGGDILRAASTQVGAMK